MDNRKSDGKIRVIEYPVSLLGFKEDGSFMSERQYQSIMFNHPDILFTGAKSIREEFPIPMTASRCDLLLDNNGEKLLIELKICENASSFHKTLGSAIDQTVGYMKNINTFNIIFDADIRVTPYIVIINTCDEITEYDSESRKTREHYSNMDEYVKWVEKNKSKNTKLDVLDVLIGKQEKKIKKIDKAIIRTDKRIANLNQIEKDKIESLKSMSKGLIIDLINNIDKGEDVVVAETRGRGINIVQNILSQSGIPYMSESKTGYDYDKKNVDESKVAYFFFSYTDIPSIVLPMVEEFSTIRYFKLDKGNIK